MKSSYVKFGGNFMIFQFDNRQSARNFYKSFDDTGLNLVMTAQSLPQICTCTTFRYGLSDQQHVQGFANLS